MLENYSIFLVFCYTDFRMTPEEHRLLERVAECVEDNNVILRRMQRSARWGAFFRVIYWILILGASYSAYLYIKPYADQFPLLKQALQNVSTYR